MADYRFTEYFEKKVLAKRPYLTKELYIRVVEAPIRFERQEANRRQGHHPQRVLRQAVQAMKVNYFPDTDSLYIDLSERPSVESREISEGVVLDYVASGHLVGIDIDNASTKVDLHRFVVSKIPASVETIAG